MIWSFISAKEFISRVHLYTLTVRGGNYVDEFKGLLVLTLKYKHGGSYSIDVYLGYEGHDFAIVNLHENPFDLPFLAFTIMETADVKFRRWLRTRGAWPL